MIFERHRLRLHMMSRKNQTPDSCENLLRFMKSMRCARPLSSPSFEDKTELAGDGTDSFLIFFGFMYDFPSGLL